MHRKESKESKVPKHYKGNTILGELHRAKKIASNFQKEAENTKGKFSKASFRRKFINCVVTQLTTTKRITMKQMKKMR